MDRKDYKEIEAIWNQGFALSRNYLDYLTLLRKNYPSFTELSVDILSDIEKRKLDNLHYLIKANINKCIELLAKNNPIEDWDERCWLNFSSIAQQWGLCCRDGYFLVRDYNDVLCSLVGNLDSAQLLNEKEELEILIAETKENCLAIIGSITND